MGAKPIRFWDFLRRPPPGPKGLSAAPIYGIFGPTRGPPTPAKGGQKTPRLIFPGTAQGFVVRKKLEKTRGRILSQRKHQTPERGGRGGGDGEIFLVGWAPEPGGAAFQPRGKDFFTAAFGPSKGRPQAAKLQTKLLLHGRFGGRCETKKKYFQIRQHVFRDEQILADGRGPGQPGQFTGPRIEIEKASVPSPHPARTTLSFSGVPTPRNARGELL